MGVKVFAVDLDGTLFYPKHTIRMISNKNLKFLRTQFDLGNKVVIVTGRSHQYVEKVIKKINRPIDELCCNGAIIKVNNEIINHKELGDSFYNAYEAIKKNFKIMASMLMSEKYQLSLYSKSFIAPIRFILKLFYKTKGVYAENVHYSTLKEEEDELKYGKVYKLMILFGIGRKARRHAIRAAQLIKDTCPEVEAAFSEQVVEITPKNCCKSEGLKMVRDYYGVTNDDIYVVGDSGNDIQMFDTFYEHSFVMAHAGEHVRCHAKHVIRRVHDLEKYLGK